MKIRIKILAVLTVFGSPNCSVASRPPRFLDIYTIPPWEDIFPALLKWAFETHAPGTFNLRALPCIHIFLETMSIICLTDRRLARSRVIRQHISRWSPLHSPTLDPMASATSEKGRVSTSNNQTEYSPDVERGGVISTAEGRAHPSGIGNPGPM
jgi:hypothetical protein